jgi:Holliday junction resolvase RusA-like endonuclease
LIDPKVFRFSIEGDAVAWERVTGIEQRRVPDGTRRFERDVWLSARVAGARLGMFDGPVLLGVRFGIRHKTKTGPCDRRPDLDNLVKAVKDGLKPIWRDDAQVVGYLGYPQTGKFYMQTPKTEVVILSLEAVLL